MKTMWIHLHHIVNSGSLLHFTSAVNNIKKIKLSNPETIKNLKVIHCLPGAALISKQDIIALNLKAQSLVKTYAKET